jgi:hypothetical protein
LGLALTEEETSDDHSRMAGTTWRVRRAIAASAEADGCFVGALLGQRELGDEVEFLVPHAMDVN